MVVKRFISWYSTRTNQSRTHLKMHAQRCSWERHANSWRCNECTLFIRSRASTRDWHTKNPTWAEPNFIGALFSYAPNPPTKTHPFLSPINERMTSHCIYWSARGCHAFGARGRAPTGRCERHEWEESGEGPGGGIPPPSASPISIWRFYLDQTQEFCANQQNLRKGQLTVINLVESNHAGRQWFWR